MDVDVLVMQEVLGLVGIEAASRCHLVREGGLRRAIHAAVRSGPGHLYQSACAANNPFGCSNFSRSVFKNAAPTAPSMAR